MQWSTDLLGSSAYLQLVKRFSGEQAGDNQARRAPLTEAVLVEVLRRLVLVKG